MVNDKDNDRLDHALEWCKKHKLKSDRLNLFNRERKKKSVRGNLSKKEFEEMCKKAGVEKGSLCKTIFTENL
ncbi:hypothetical protein ES704_01039 [subsurface metagenome]|jgi:hypothetical protein